MSEYLLKITIALCCSCHVYTKMFPIHKYYREFIYLFTPKCSFLACFILRYLASRHIFPLQPETFLLPFLSKNLEVHERRHKISFRWIECEWRWRWNNVFAYNCIQMLLNMIVVHRNQRGRRNQCHHKPIVEKSNEVIHHQNGGVPHCRRSNQ